MKQLLIGIVMDPLETIWATYDGTLKLMLAAQKKNCKLFYITPENLYWQNNKAYALSRTIKVYDSETHWFDYLSEEDIPLDSLDIILMRKDPPFDMNYIYATYFLEHAAQAGVYVVNHPQSLRDANEKFFITHFPQCIAPTMISANLNTLKKFHRQHEKVVFKPLDSMAGKGIFIAHLNENVDAKILELIKNKTPIMAQRYIPAVTQGDKRIFLIKGEALPYALARFPAEGDILDASREDTVETAVALTTRDQWICDQLKPILQAKKLDFVGIDVIGDYLTEINVTSPGIITEMSQAYHINIAELIVDKLLS